MSLNMNPEMFDEEERWVNIGSKKDFDDVRASYQATLNTWSFTLFPDLPLEIRLEIWRIARHLFPRIVHTRFSWELNGREGRVGQIEAPPNRTLLAVNRESRAELRRFYKCQPHPPLGLLSNISMDYGCDTLHLNYYARGRRSRISMEAAFKMLCEEDQGFLAAGLRSLSANKFFWRQAGFRFKDLIHKLSCLDELIWVITGRPGKTLLTARQEVMDDFKNQRNEFSLLMLEGDPGCTLPRFRLCVRAGHTFEDVKSVGYMPPFAPPRTKYLPIPPITFGNYFQNLGGEDNEV